MHYSKSDDEHLFVAEKSHHFIIFPNSLDLIILKYTSNAT